MAELLYKSNITFFILRINDRAQFNSTPILRNSVNIVLIRNVKNTQYDCLPSEADGTNKEYTVLQTCSQMLKSVWTGRTTEFHFPVKTQVEEISSEPQGEKSLNLCNVPEGEDSEVAVG